MADKTPDAARRVCDCDRLGRSLDDECVYDDPCPARKPADASRSRLVGVWFTNHAGWDRGTDHAVTEEVAEAQEGRTLCGRPLGRRFVFTGDDFDATANYSCSTCRKAAARVAA